jgi:uncharacterized membrane protein
MGFAKAIDNDIAKSLPDSESEVLLETPASIAGHPSHPFLAAVPIGLWVISLFCDMMAFSASDPTSWNLVAFYCMGSGVVGALVAAASGLMDLISLKDPQNKKIALWHMGLNMAIIVLYAINAGIRAGSAAPPDSAILLSFIAVGLVVVSGWVGGESVHIPNVSVAEASSKQSEWTSLSSSRETEESKRSALTGR